MKAYCHMDIRQLPVEVKDIFETFSGTPEECYAWGISKRNEFLDLTSWAYQFNGYISITGFFNEKDPNSFMIFVAKPYKDFILVRYYGNEE